jgi:hypothetical protein
MIGDFLVLFKLDAKTVMYERSLRTYQNTLLVTEKELRKLGTSDEALELRHSTLAVKTRKLSSHRCLNASYVDG